MQPLPFVRLSRHAKNRARRLGIGPGDVAAVIAQPMTIDRDVDGRPRYTGEIRGRWVRVVVAVDKPGLIVTIHERDR